MTEVTAVGTVGAILAVVGFVWAAIASQRARDDRQRLKTAMQQLAQELNAADETNLNELIGSTGPSLKLRSDSLSSPEEIVARAVELARTQEGDARVNVRAGRVTRITTEPEDRNNPGPPAPASH